MTTYLAGVGMTPFGKFRDSSLGTLGRAAGRDALADAGVDPHRIEMIACGSARSGMLQARESGVGQLIGWDLGIEGVPVYNEKAFCASGAVAFNIAHMALTAGAHDVALVVGANDVVNPAARYDKSSPIYGMPIIDADKARSVFAVKRSKNPGFAGIDNELYFADRTWMLFGDAKNMIGELVKQLAGGSGMH